MEWRDSKLEFSSLHFELEVIYLIAVTAVESVASAGWRYAPPIGRQRRAEHENRLRVRVCARPMFVYESKSEGPPSYLELTAPRSLQDPLNVLPPPPRRRCSKLCF